MAITHCQLMSISLPSPTHFCGFCCPWRVFIQQNLTTHSQQWHKELHRATLVALEDRRLTWKWPTAIDLRVWNSKSNGPWTPGNRKKKWCRKLRSKHCTSLCTIHTPKKITIHLYQDWFSFDLKERSYTFHSSSVEQTVTTFHEILVGSFFHVWRNNPQNYYPLFSRNLTTWKNSFICLVRMGHLDSWDV